MSFETEIKIDFLNEAKDFLCGTEQCFLSLEKNPTDLENLNRIFRLAHNLKGSSQAVGFPELADFTHKLESLLLALKEGRRSVTKMVVDLLLRTNDYLVATVETLQGDVNASYANPDLANELVLALKNEFDIETNSVYGETSTLHESAPGESSCPEVLPAKINHPIAAAATQKPKDENIRVSLLRIENLINNVGELSILQAVMVQQGIDFSSHIPQLMRDTLSSMTKIIKETQNISMGMRMLPIKQTFQKMERIVRDTSQALGKSVELHLSGEETEIDKTVLEQLADPLVHIIRNAVDHGLENSSTRKEIGKSETGHVHLFAFHRAGQIVIEIRDDGKGLDADKLISKAIEKGVISPDAKLTKEQAYHLIFAPGFSTKEVVTDVSGRGVGMDVVKTNITALQGSIEIETKLGEGTCFRIFLPLTLAIIDSIIIQSFDQRFVIPLSQVTEFFRPQEKDINFVYDRSEVLTLRKEPLGVFRLSELLGQASRQQHRSAWDLNALIVRDGSQNNAAILVDRIIAQQQVVIKPLGAEIKGKAGVMGSAILGDGRPALILDLFELIKSKKGFEKSVNLKTNLNMETA